LDSEQCGSRSIVGIRAVWVGVGSGGKIEQIDWSGTD
jgi:hypothetical protein